MNKKICELAEDLGCTVLIGENLKNYTTMKTGGVCSCIIYPRTFEDCTALISALKSEGEPYFIMGKGSNVIADDGGYSGTVMIFGRDMSEISVNGNTVTVQSGASLGEVCRKALEHSLTGLEFAYGIPGSAGGAVYMNAGAYGGEMSDVITCVYAADPESGGIKKFLPDELDMSYRHSVFTENKYIILSAELSLEKGDPKKIESKMKELISKRKEKQPLEYPSAGSTFKRPQGSYASLLIEQCGLKGLSVGGAEVSRKHSGFIINKGNATSNDILTLIEKVRTEVRSQTGYDLECEPVILKDNA